MRQNDALKGTPSCDACDGKEMDTRLTSVFLLIYGLASL